jgi:hypothetical protein
MYLELQDTRTQIPVRDPNTNEILLFDAQAFANLAPIEVSAALEELPAIMNEMEAAGVIDSATREQLIQETIQTVNEANQIAQNNALAVQQAPLDTRWSGSFNIEPSPKPWFARPEIILPGVALVGFSIWALTRKK